MTKNSFSFRRFVFSYNFFCFCFFNYIAYLQFRFVDERITRWFDLNSKINYPYLPDVLFLPAVFIIAKYTFILTCVFCGFNIFRRQAILICFLSGLVYFIQLQSIGTAGHKNHLVQLMIGLVAYYELQKKYQLSDFLAWARFAFISVFFSAGITKLLESGMGYWFNSETHLNFLLMNRFSYGVHPFLGFDLSLFAIEHLEYLKYFIYMALPLELICPLFLTKRFRYGVALIAIMQISAYYTLYPDFYEYMPMYLVWFNLTDESRTVS